MSAKNCYAANAFTTMAKPYCKGRVCRVYHSILPAENMHIAQFINGYGGQKTMSYYKIYRRTAWQAALYTAFNILIYNNLLIYLPFPQYLYNARRAKLLVLPF
jgi:hypothetical protein